MKHFPGHGDTSQDSHLTLPRLAHDKQRLWEVELVPFVAAARAGLASVMTAHVRFEAFDRLPATLSPVSLAILRKDVEFRGCCISDDLEMQRHLRHLGRARRGRALHRRRLRRGAGLPHAAAPARLHRRHRPRGTRRPPSRERLEEACAARVQTLQKFARPPSRRSQGKGATLPVEEHRAFAAQLDGGRGARGAAHRSDRTHAEAATCA